MKDLKVGSVVLTSRNELAVILDNHPSRPKYPWVYQMKATGARYKCGEADIKAVLGEIDLQGYLTAANQQPALPTVTTNLSSLPSQLQGLTVGDKIQITGNRGVEDAIYKGYVPSRHKYPVLVEMRGKIFKCPLTAVVRNLAKARDEKSIMEDIRKVYCNLSPENLSCDGEIPMRLIRRRREMYLKELKTLFTELGREVSESEAYQIA